MFTDQLKAAGPLKTAGSVDAGLGNMLLLFPTSKKIQQGKYIIKQSTDTKSQNRVGELETVLDTIHHGGHAVKSREAKICRRGCCHLWASKVGCLCDEE